MPVAKHVVKVAVDRIFRAKIWSGAALFAPYVRKKGASRKFSGIAQFLASHFLGKRYGILHAEGLTQLTPAKEK